MAWKKGEMCIAHAIQGCTDSRVTKNPLNIMNNISHGSAICCACSPDLAIAAMACCEVLPIPLGDKILAIDKESDR